MTFTTLLMTQFQFVSEFSLPIIHVHIKTNQFNDSGYIELSALLITMFRKINLGEGVTYFVGHGIVESTISSLV